MSTAKIPIIFVHGFWDKSSVFNRMAKYLERKGWSVYYDLNLQPNNGKITIEEMAGQLSHYIDRLLGPSTPFSLVGFSMGGLVSRYYVQKMDENDRVKHLITISSPHRGTWSAYVFNRKACIQMRPQSAFLNDLNKDLSKLQRIKFTSIWGYGDSMIVPNASSHLPVGNEKIFAFGIHFLMPYVNNVIKGVEKSLIETKEVEVQ